MGGLRTWIEGVLYVSEVDADRQRWPSLSSLDRGPWTVDRGVGPFGRAVLSCAVRAVGRWVGAVRCGAVLWCRRSWVQMSRRSVLAALLGRRKKCGTGWTAEAGAGAEAEAEAAVDAVGCCCCSYRRDFRQSTRATVEIRQGGKRTTRGYQKKMSEDGRLIQNCATTGAAATVKLAR